MNIVFPAGAFRENGGPVLDITKAPFLAKGDGTTDDTQAFIRVLNFLRDELDKSRKSSKNPYSGRHSWTVYLPNGTYLVSDSLLHEGDLNFGFCFLRLVGQDRNQTIIRLKDNSPGFQDPSKPKTVLPWARIETGTQGNIMWGNQGRNFTIDTGSGNPGAIGMNFMGANACSLDNITIRSGDGQGVVGLDLPWWSVQGHFCDITIQGFDTGIRSLERREIQPTFEYVTLQGQKKQGILLSGTSATSLRKILFADSAGPAIYVNGVGTHLVMVESTVNGKENPNPAIRIDNPDKNEVFLREIQISGYASALLQGEKTLPAGPVREFVSGQIVKIAPTPARSMKLPVREALLVPWESDPANWASPEDFEGSIPQRIQAALNSGKPAIYFPKSYRERGDFTIPATVRQIDFLHLDEVQGRFIVAERSETPLWIEHAQRRQHLIIREPRQVHARYGSIRLEVETKEPVRIFMENQAVLTGGHTDKFCPANVRFYARSINDEDRSHPNYVVNGGSLWVLGFKTEAHRESFLVRKGGFLEVLGGYRNHAGTGDQGLPMVHSDGGNVSFVGCTYMSRDYREAIWNTELSQTTKFQRTQFPVRDTGHPNNYFVPLFVRYNPAAVPPQ